MRAHDRELDQRAAATAARRSSTRAVDPVVARAASAGVVTPGAAPAIQRRVGNAAFTAAVQRSRHAHGPGCGHEAAEGAPVQRSAAEQETPVQRSSVDEVTSGSGEALDSTMQAELKAHHGVDFSGMRVHRDAAADRSARELQADAYTTGNHMVFRSGKYNPSTVEGRHLIRHESFHPLQQSAGPVQGDDRGDGVHVSSPQSNEEVAAESGAHEMTQMYG